MPPVPNTPISQSQKRASAQVYTSGSTSLTITPNYQNGFGAVYFYSQTGQPLPYSNGYLPSSPTHGPGASLGGGGVDFGSVQRGQDYLYRYAVKLQISSTAGIAVFGAAASDLVGASQTLPISTHLYWAATDFHKSSPYGEDANTPFTAIATPFQLESAGVTNASTLYTSTSGSATLLYDFILRLGATDPLDSYATSIVYTVVSQ